MKIPMKKENLTQAGRTLLFTICLLPLLYLQGCYTVPETGRTALNLVPDAQVEALALQSFDQIKQEEKISHDTEMTDRVKRVGGRIAEAAKAQFPDTEWEFLVFENDEMINAFALPGGKVGVYSGMFKIATTDNLLAIVMGHEIGHVAAKHGSQRMSRAILTQAAAIAVSESVSDSDYWTRQMAGMAFSLGANLGYMLPYSRLSENEADHIGLLYAARAGYNPEAAIELWEKMGEAKDGEEPPAFFSTHPNHDTRIENLKKLMPEALEAYHEALKKVEE